MKIAKERLMGNVAWHGVYGIGLRATAALQSSFDITCRVRRTGTKFTMMLEALWFPMVERSLMLTMASKIF